MCTGSACGMHGVGELNGVAIFPPSIHSFNKSRLSIHEASGPGLGARDTAVYETEPLPSRGLLPGGLRRLRYSVQFSSVIQLCLTLCNPMDCSTPGFPVHHQLLEPAQTPVH